MALAFRLRKLDIKQMQAEQQLQGSVYVSWFACRESSLFRKLESRRGRVILKISVSKHFLGVLRSKTNAMTDSDRSTWCLCPLVTKSIITYVASHSRDTTCHN